MSDVSGFVTRDVRIAETALWAGAVLLTIGAYAGVAAWMLRSDPVVAADNAPPAAIMIEIADAPQATLVEMNEITPDLATSNESLAQNEQKREPTQPRETPADKPLKVEEARPVEDEVTEEKPAPVERVEVPLPAVQPKREMPKEKPKDKPKDKPKPQQAAAQSKAALQAQVQVQQSEHTAAAQTASGVSSQSPANWQSQVMAHLERRKRYPAEVRARGARGTVYVRFTIDGSGNVLSASLVQSSGFPELDQETLALVRRASPIPTPPPGANRSITAPVRFSPN
ncbi:energy transducer TonB family protein [Bradyrhizobium sp.]|uniref:energy transducer TonB family protein n=1 Tax=Bradyrhizobium sp. TaxID=376 RepID=UPI0039E5B19A